MPPITSLPKGFELLREGEATVVVRASAAEQLLALGMLERPMLEMLRAKGRPIGRGRGQAVSIPLDPMGADRVILRHCRRGGMLGSLLGDTYFRGNRPLEELRVSEAARSAGVPTPECLAAMTWRKALGYSGDVLVREVSGAVSLEEWLSGDDASASTTMQDVAGALADTFAKLVAANIYHPDLHAGNVLIESDGDVRVHIIDFDKARQMNALPAGLRDRMLFRFNRALVKRRLAPRPVSLLTRMRFFRRLGIAEGREKTRRFVSECRSHLKRHSWHY